MRITPKEPRIVQAQAAQFASEHIKDSDTRAEVLGNLSNIAVEAWRTPADDAFTDQDYANFLTRTRQEGHSDIFKNRADIINSFADFEEDVKLLNTTIQNSTASDMRIGMGETSSAYQIDHNGVPYVVRKTTRGDFRQPAVVTDRHIAAATLTRGIPHFEQVVAASYENGVTISEKMPGKTFEELKIQDVSAITDMQLEEFINTVQTAERLGVAIDFNEANFFYAPQIGFGLIDLQARSDAYYSDLPKRSLGYQVGQVIISLFNGVLPDNSSWSSRTRHKELMRATDDVLKRYKNIISKMLDEHTAHEAISKIDKEMIAINEFRKELKI